jgi:hypothetical protein
MAEHILEENCVKIVEIIFRLNWKNMTEHSRAGLVKVSA